MKVVLGSSPQEARKSFCFSEVEGNGMIQSDFLEYLDTMWKMQSRDRGGKKTGERAGSDSTAYPREEPGRSSNNGES